MRQLRMDKVKTPAQDHKSRKWRREPSQIWKTPWLGFFPHQAKPLPFNEQSKFSVDKQTICLTPIHAMETYFNFCIIIMSQSTWKQFTLALPLEWGNHVLSHLDCIFHIVGNFPFLLPNPVLWELELAQLITMADWNKYVSGKLDTLLRIRRERREENEIPG